MQSPTALQVRYACEDLALLRQRLKDLGREIERKLDQHEIGKLLTTIDGVGLQTAACLIAELIDPARFPNAGALASYVGVTPRLRQSGKRRFSGRRSIPLGNARLRRALWMPILAAVRCNPWLRDHYQRLRVAGKPPKVALIACMRKLLTAIHSVARNRRPFVPQLRPLSLSPPQGARFLIVSMFYKAWEPVQL
jgi:transposase